MGRLTRDDVEGRIVDKLAPCTVGEVAKYAKNRTGSVLPMAKFWATAPKTAALHNG